MKSAVVLLAFVGMVFAGQSGEHGGGQSGEHGARNCSIVPSTTTSCAGVTGTSCTDSSNLRVNYFFSYKPFKNLELKALTFERKIISYPLKLSFSKDRSPSRPLQRLVLF